LSERSEKFAAKLEEMEVKALNHADRTDGNIVSKTLSDGTLASYTYDAANRLTSLNHTLSGTSFARFDYGYDSELN